LGPFSVLVMFWLGLNSNGVNHKMPIESHDGRQDFFDHIGSASVSLLGCFRQWRKKDTTFNDRYSDKHK
jgi:hypothetical protein